MNSIFDGKKNLKFFKDNKREIVFGFLITLVAILVMGYYVGYSAKNFVDGEKVSLERSSELYLEGDLEKSTRMLEVVYESDPENEEIAQKLAKQYFESKDYDKFVSLYDENQFSGSLLVNMYASIKSQRGESEIAEDYYKKSIAENPKNSNTYINLATHYITRGDLDSAKEIIGQAIEIKPDYTKLLIFASSLYKRTGEIDQARDYINKALEIDADNVQAKAIAESL